MQSPFPGFLMDDLQRQAGQLRLMAELLGTDWLQSQITAMQGQTVTASAGIQTGLPPPPESFRFSAGAALDREPGLGPFSPAGPASPGPIRPGIPGGGGARRDGYTALPLPRSQRG